MTKEFMDRRGFVKGATTAMFMTAVPFNRSLMKGFNDDKPLRFCDALVSALVDDRKEFDSARFLPPTDQEVMDGMIDSLIYAYEKIRPETYDEASFVVACGLLDLDREYPDEYMRRKRGEASFLPDHPLFALRGYSMPDTRRILIFTEQMECLFRELLSLNRLIKKCERGFIRNEISLEAFTSCLRRRYRESLTHNEREIIFCGIQRSIDCTESYVWCSSIVNRAIAKANSLHI